MRPSLLFLFLLLSLSSSSVGLEAQTDTSLARVGHRYREALVESELAESTPLPVRARTIIASESPAGSWTSVDYSDVQSSQWKVAEHLALVHTLAAEAYAARSSGRPDTALEARALAGLRYWIKKNYLNQNWWWNQIGIPTQIGEIGLMLEPSLTATDRQGIDKILLRSAWDTMTGQNLVWMAQIHVMRGLLNNDDAYVTEAFRRMFEEVRVVPETFPDGKPGEGILEDHSFHQHGQQLYSGGYGLGFAQDMTQMVLLTFGTRFQMSAECFAIYEGLILDGDQWMVRGGTFDHATRGREITRTEKPFDAKAEFTRRLEKLAALPLPRQVELKAFADRLAQAPNTHPLIGDRMFWESDYSAHHRAGYSASVRMFSTRTKNSEIINKEGLRSFHLADGMNLLYVKGDEYRGIFPVWDWTMIPGTTAVHATKADGTPQTFEAKPVSQMGETTFVGGASDGRYGAETMDLKRGPLTAKKSWFFFDDFYVCLGADIRLENTDTPADVATDVNQALLRGAVQTDLADKANASGSHSILGTTYVFHDGVGYIFAPDAPVMLSNTTQSGRWSDIGAGSRAEVKLGVFNLWIDHGTNPRDSSYAYGVFPATTREQTAAAAKSLPYTVLANTSSIQAVYVAALHRSEIVFRTAGTVKTPDGDVSASSPCVLLIDASGPLTVTAANPDQVPVNLLVSVGDRKATLKLTDGRSVSAKPGAAKAN